MTCLTKFFPQRPLLHLLRFSHRGPSYTMRFTGIAIPFAAPPSKAHFLK
jgi:hypothetical protein